ncbi:YhdP family protein [Wenzhouxiangella sp. XN24]|uniref:YhdP family protein n=1 Tax=Wenzhouxiangella sp. XN24 TaxID=2713569 RepID=UPI0013E9F7C2|nr:YhdP family protein [Wenzhouxiangella sp. XN24]NGX15912.1 TIGR02099 family protein [Wenzhouxiangella sp. XN24]
MIRKLWRVLAGVVAGVVVLLALLVGVARVALVQAPEYRAQVEALAGDALGRPVRLGEIDARLGLRGPELSFSDASILTADGAEILLRADEGSIQFAAWPLLRGELRPGAIRLAGLSLRIEREVGGDEWRLLGAQGPLLRERGTGADPRLGDLAHWPAGQLELEDVELQFEDLHLGLPPRTFRLDTLHLRVGGGRVALDAVGVLPESLGGALTLSAAVSAQDARGFPQDWTAGMSFAALDLQALAAAIGDPAWLRARGIVDGNVSVAADEQGLARIAGDAVARDLWLLRDRDDDAATPEVAPPPVPYDSLGTEFEWTRQDGGWHLGLRNLEVVRADRAWRSAAATVALEGQLLESPELLEQIVVRADRLELEDLLPAVRWLPEEPRSMVRALLPSGTLHGVDVGLDWRRDEGSVAALSVSAGFEALSLAPWNRWPGVRNLSGRISGDLSGGTLTLAGNETVFSLPSLFRAPLTVTSLAVAAGWVRDAEGFRLGISRMALANEDATLNGRLALEVPADGTSPVLEIDAEARDLSLDAAPAYLPVGIMPARVVEWLDRALLAGGVEAAHIRFEGPTRAFPFRGDEGLFKVEFDIDDGLLDFDRRWPRARALDATVRFENEGLWADLHGGRLLEVEVGPASVAIPDLRAGVLTIDGGARGELAALREFALSADLLQRILAPGLAPATVTGGRANAEVALVLPLKALATSRARVELSIIDGVAAYDFLGAPLRDIQAQLDIDNARVTGEGISATLAGSPVLLDVTVDASDAIRLSGGGRLDAAALSEILRLPEEPMSGVTDWKGWLQFPAPGAPAPVEFEIHSSLQGMKVGWPEPFRKAADDMGSLRFSGRFLPDSLLDIELEWDAALRLAARLDQSGKEPRFGIVPGGLGGDLPGLVFSGAVPRLDLGAWIELAGPSYDGPGQLTDMIAGGRVLIGELSAPLVDLRDVLVDVSRGATHWSVDLNANRAAGHLDVPFSLYGDEPVTARLDYLWLGAATEPPGTAGEAELTPASPPQPGGLPVRLNPARIPPLDIQVEDLRYGPIRFGSVSALALHEGDGIELIGLEGIGEGFIFQAEGRSRLSPTVDASRLGVRIQSDDVGATLDFMGFNRGMEAQSGVFEAEVSWQGGLRSDWLEAIAGTAKVDIRDGSLVGVEPGAGRVFGLLSLQALPRRLALDFKDVFGKGTSFDRITGDFRLEDGHAYTDDLLMSGPAANMAVVGRTGLVTRDYDQTAVIGADFGGTFPVAGAVVAGPAVGAALFLLAEIFNNPFSAQITYRLTGPWDDPVIARVPTGSRSNN